MFQPSFDVHGLITKTTLDILGVLRVLMIKTQSKIFSMPFDGQYKMGEAQG